MGANSAGLFDTKTQQAWCLLRSKILNALLRAEIVANLIYFFITPKNYRERKEEILYKSPKAYIIT